MALESAFMFPSSNSKDRVFSGQKCIGATPAGNEKVKTIERTVAKTP